jgi:hypothetical protein
MTRIIGDEGVGKATQVVRRSFDTKENIICANEERRKILLAIAKYNNYEIPPIYTIDEVLFGQKTFKKCTESVIIDESDLCLTQVLKKNISLVTTTI